MMIKYIIIALYTIQITCQVLGIDFGTEYFKASLISPGKTFAIIENTTTKRKTENAIAFYNHERMYEGDAVSKKTKSPKNTFLFLNKFVGALADNQQIIEISKSLYEEFQIVADERHGGFAFVIDGINFEGKESITLNIEELLGMIFKYIVRLVDNHHNIQVKDCVITVPSEWGVSQRTALKSAASMADLEVLAFINENTAAALYYGLDRSDDNKHTVLFYNVGAYNIQASLVEYLAIESQNNKKSDASNNKKKVETVKVLADYSIGNQGGQQYDLALANYFGQQFDALPSRQGKKSIFSNFKAFNKLLKASNKYKEMLSANKEVPVYIEGLIDGEDFSTQIQRAKFEELVANLTNNLAVPIEYVLNKANMTKEDINIVELIGGGIRVPKVQQTLNEYFGNIEVGAHMNGDESMALGAAFHAANLSHSFKVRQVQLTDGLSFGMHIEIKGVDDDYYKEFSLFPYKKKYGSTRSMEFNYDKNLQLIISIIKDNQKIPYVTYHLQNITAASELNFSKPEVSFTFKITPNEFLKLEQAECKVEEIKLIEIKRNKTNINETKSENKTQNTQESQRKQEQDIGEEEDQEQQKQQEQQEQQEQQQQEQLQSESEEEEEQQKQSEQQQQQEQQDQYQEQKQEKEQEQEQQPEEPQYRKQKINHVFPINVTAEYHIVGWLNKTEIDSYKKVIQKFEESEDKARKLSEVKNKLESLIYQTREFIETEHFEKASIESEREQIKQKNEEHGHFIESEEAWNAEFETFNQKLTQLQNLMKPILRRLDEYKIRPAAVNETITKLTEFHKKANSLNQTMPWIPEEKKLKFFGVLVNNTDWIKEKMELQQGKELHEDPVFLAEDLTKKIEQISREYAKLKNIPKPKKPKEEDKEKDKKSEDKKQETKKDEGQNQQQQYQNNQEDNNKQQTEDKTDL